MNKRELETIFNVMNTNDIAISESELEKLKKRILFLSEPFFEKEES